MPSELILGRTSSAPRSFGFAERARHESGQLITYAGDGHLVTFAPTGSGKTSGPVICNALKHPGQLIVLDMKGEVYAATAAARRAMGQKVHVLDIRDGDGCGHRQSDGRRVMKAVFSFVPKFCPCCGKELNIHKEQYRKDDWHSGASQRCDCGLHFAASTEEAIHTAADTINGDMRQHA